MDAVFCIFCVVQHSYCVHMCRARRSRMHARERARCRTKSRYVRPPRVGCVGCLLALLRWLRLLPAGFSSWSGTCTARAWMALAASRALSTWNFSTRTACALGPPTTACHLQFTPSAECLISWCGCLCLHQYVIVPNAVPEENVDALIREMEQFLDM